MTAQCASPATSSDDDNNDDDDDDEDDDNNANNNTEVSQPSASSKTSITNGAIGSTASFPTNIAVPSTSTGITTANGMRFTAHFIQYISH